MDRADSPEAWLTGIGTDNMRALPRLLLGASWLDTLKLVVGQ
jgi:hypothetical protein